MGYDLSRLATVGRAKELAGALKSWAGAEIGSVAATIGTLSELAPPNNHNLVAAINQVWHETVFHYDVLCRAEEIMTEQGTAIEELKARVKALEANFPSHGKLVVTGAATYTSNGITFTNNDDGSVTVNGTKTGSDAAKYTVGRCTLDPGGYAILCGDSSTATRPSGSSVFAYVIDASDSWEMGIASSQTDDTMFFEVSDVAVVWEVRIMVQSGTYSGKKVWPRVLRAA